MSLNIEVDHVTGVLLVGGWLHVGKGTFELDTYEFQREGTPLHSGGESGTCSRGFSFLSGGELQEDLLVGTQPSHCGNGNGKAEPT